MINNSKKKSVMKKASISKFSKPTSIKGTGIFSASTNKEVARSSKMKNNKGAFLYIELVGIDPSVKKFVSVDVSVNISTGLLPNSDEIISSMENWKLWGSAELSGYMGTSEYEIVTMNNYPLKWAMDMAEKYNNSIEYSSWCKVMNLDLVKIVGKSYVGFSAKLVASDLVSIPVLEHAECRSCLCSKDTFYKIDNVKDVLDGYNNKLVGTCSDCVYVEVMKNAVACHICEKMVNVLGIAPGKKNDKTTCMECVVSSFVKV